MSLHQLKPSTLSLSLLLLIWSFESPARSHPTPRVALHTGTLSEQRVPEHQLCTTTRRSCVCSRAIGRKVATWREVDLTCELVGATAHPKWHSLYFYSQSAETIHHTVWKMTSIIRMIVMTILALKRNFFWLFVRACPQLPILSLSYPLSAPPNVTISPKKSGHYSAMLLKTQIIKSHLSQL